MPNLLRLDASARLTGSRSRELGDYLARRLIERQPEMALVHRDLTTNPLQHIADATITGFYTPPEAMTDALRRRPRFRTSSSTSCKAPTRF